MLALKNQIPRFRILLPFLAGRLVYIYGKIEIPFWPLILGTSLAFQLLVNTRFKLPFNYRWLAGLTLHLSIFIIAFQLTRFNNEMNYSAHFGPNIQSNQIAKVRVIESFVEKEKTLKTIVEVISIEKQGQWISTKGKAMLYFQKDSNSLKIKYGDVLIINPTFKSIDSPKNPQEFNYKQYLAFHNVFYQCYLSNQKWIHTNNNEGNFILNVSINLRNYFLDVFKKYNIIGNEFAVGSALILGFEDKLNPEIISAYSSSGALHVLSVSGLHIAIIYVVLLKLLFFLDKFKNGKIIKAIILVLVLWFYACLTGLSPSVMRAATMFSFIIVGKLFNRYTNVYNTLAASALLLLIINPYLIMEVGFQLSFLAVFGIVMLQPGIYNLLETNNWLLDQIWTVTTVSIAAQLATFPLGLLYFHQFPNYFLLSNLLVIPLSALILYLGILLLIVSKITFLGTWIAWLLSQLISFLNTSVIVFENAPYAIVEGVSIGILETWLVYGMLICMVVFFFQKRHYLIHLSLSFFVIFLSIQIIEKYDETTNSQLVVYSIKKQSAIDFIEGDKNYFVSDTLLYKNKSTMLFHVYHNWWEQGVVQHKFVAKDYSESAFYKKDNFMMFNNKKILIVNSALVLKKQPGKTRMKIDYIILSNNSKQKIASLLTCFDCEYFIIDSSNSFYKAKKWQQDCEKMDKKCFNVLEDGAFVLNI